MARCYTIFSAACQTHTRCTLNWTKGGRHAGREAEGKSEEGCRMGAREQGEGVGEQGEGGWERELRREGGLRKGTSEEGTELGMNGARERGEGRKRAEERRYNGARERYREERARREIGGRETSLQGVYPDEDTGQYSIHCSKLPTTRPVPLSLWY